MVSGDAAQGALRDHFFGWQCRLRQLSIRQKGGRPTSGICPRVSLAPDVRLGEIVVLIVKREPDECITQFQHMYRQTQDPAERYSGALRFLAAAYYQRPREFSDEITALFGPRSEVAQRILGARRCVLEFEQFSQRYRLPCLARNIPDTDPAYQATYWHNCLFNPELPLGVRVLGFEPDWAAAEMERVGTS